MGMTGQPHTWVLQALGGKKCSYFAGIVSQVLTTYNPDVIFLDCGTNDTPTDNTEADYRTILASVASFNALGHDTLLVASLIGVPDMKSDTNKIRPYIIDWMLNTNLAIQRALADYPNVPVANMWKVPATPEWLLYDGIHLIPRSEAAYAQLFYEAAQPHMGWLTLAQMRTTGMCGLNGIFRSTDPWPIPDVDYRVCRN
jgi:lysophospholipase L1-like esterase